VKTDGNVHGAGGLPEDDGGDHHGIGQPSAPDADADTFVSRLDSHAPSASTTGRTSQRPIPPTPRSWLMQAHYGRPTELISRVDKPSATRGASSILQLVERVVHERAQALAEPLVLA
jgi:hypothetical protein